MAKVTIQKLQEMKQNGEKISYVTAYDFGQATLVEKAGIEMILVGDSMSMTMLGNDSTVPLTTDQMVHHIKAVVKGAPSPMIVGDLVFGSYNEGPEQAIRSANRLLKEGGCDVVKLEGCMPETVRRMVEAGIGVQGHIGLTRYFSVKLPLKPFFLFTSVLLFLLCISFMGKGVVELTEADVIVGRTVIPAMNGFRIEALSIYDRAETLIPQVMLVIAAVWIILSHTVGKKKRKG